MLYGIINLKDGLRTKAAINQEWFERAYKFKDDVLALLLKDHAWFFPGDPKGELNLWELEK